MNDTIDFFDYGMYTDAGNMIVANMVDRARSQGWDWKQTYQALVALESVPGAEEATDTEVRECVYHKLGFHKTDQSFWA
jgi:hypothetical protein